MQFYCGKLLVFGCMVDCIMLLVDCIQVMFIDCGICNFFVKGGIEDVVVVLMGKCILMVMGFMVGCDFIIGCMLLEIDGFVGIGEKVVMFVQVGYDIIVVIDLVNMFVFQLVFDIYLGGYFVKFELFDVKCGQFVCDVVNELFDCVQFEVVVVIELLVCNVDGDYLNMCGILVVDVNVLKDQIILEVNKCKGIVMVGVGDGGNEVGMGSLCSKILLVMLVDGSIVDFVLMVLVDFFVMVWNFNFGVQVILVNMLCNMGWLDFMFKLE